MATEWDSTGYEKFHYCNLFWLMSLWRIKGEGEIAKETKENKSVQKRRMKSQTIWASQKASENPVLRKK